MVWVWILGATEQFSYFPLNGEILQPKLSENPDTATVKKLEFFGRETVEAIFKGVS